MSLQFDRLGLFGETSEETYKRISVQEIEMGDTRVNKKELIRLEFCQKIEYLCKKYLRYGAGNIWMAGYMSNEESVIRAIWHRAIDNALTQKFLDDYKARQETVNKYIVTDQTKYRIKSFETNPSISMDNILMTLEQDKSHKKQFTKKEAMDYFKNLGIKWNELVITKIKERLLPTLEPYVEYKLCDATIEKAQSIKEKYPLVENLIEKLNKDKNSKREFTKTEAENYFKDLGITKSYHRKGLIKTLAQAKDEDDAGDTTAEEKYIASSIVSRKISARVSAGNCQEHADTAVGIIIDNIEEAIELIGDVYVMRGGLNKIDHEYLLVSNESVSDYTPPIRETPVQRGGDNTVEEAKVQAPPSTIVIDPWRLVGQVLYWKHSAWYERSGGQDTTKRWELKLSRIKEIAEEFEKKPEKFRYPKNWSELIKDNEFCKNVFASVREETYKKEQADKQYTGENITKAMNYWRYKKNIWSTAKGKKKEGRKYWQSEWNKINEILGKGIDGREEGKNGSWFKLEFKEPKLPEDNEETT